MRTHDSTPGTVLPSSRALRGQDASGTPLRQEVLGEVVVPSGAVYLGARSGENGLDGVVVRVQPGGAYRVVATVDDRSGTPSTVAVSLVLSDADETRREALPGAAFWHDAPGDLPLVPGAELLVCDAQLRDEHRDPAWPWSAWLADVIDPALADAGAAGHPGVLGPFPGRSELLAFLRPLDGDVALFAGFDDQHHPTALHLERLDAALAPPPWVTQASNAAAPADAPVTAADASPFRRSTFQPPTEESDLAEAAPPSGGTPFGSGAEQSPFGISSTAAAAAAPAPGPQGSFGPPAPQAPFGQPETHTPFGTPAPQDGFAPREPQGSFGISAAPSPFGVTATSAPFGGAPSPNARPQHPSDEPSPTASDAGIDDPADRPISASALGSLIDEPVPPAAPQPERPSDPSTAAGLPSMPEPDATAAAPASSFDDPGAQRLVADAVNGMAGLERGDAAAALPLLTQVTEALAGGFGERPVVRTGLAEAELTPARLIDALTDALLATGRDGEAITRLTSALTGAHPLIAAEEALHLGHRLGALQLRAGDTTGAVTTLEAARTGADALVHTAADTASAAAARAYLAQSTFDLASALLQSGEPGSAAELACDAMRTFEALHRPRMAGRSAFLAASAYDELGHEASRLESIAEAERIFREGDELDGLGTALGYLGEADARRGDYAPATVKFERARTMLEQAGNFASAAIAAENEAVCLDGIGDTDAAADRRRQAIELGARASTV